MSVNSILKHFMTFNCNDQAVQNYYDKMNSFLDDKHGHMEYDDLVKICETILRFASSDKAISNLDGLVVLKTFVERLSSILLKHSDKSELKLRLFSLNQLF